MQEQDRMKKDPQRPSEDSNVKTKPNKCRDESRPPIGREPCKGEIY